MYLPIHLFKVSAVSLEDFGHVFSNVSYILSGFIFIVIAFVRSSRYKVGFGFTVRIHSAFTGFYTEIFW